MTKLSILLITGLCCFSVNADTRLLVCKSAYESEAPSILEGSIGRICSSTTPAGQELCRKTRRNIDKLKSCFDNGDPCEIVKTIQFDSSALECTSGNQFAEAITESPILERAIEKLRIEATPSYIQFIAINDGKSFTVNRETLNGGFNSNSNFKCEVKAAPALKKKI